ncbi:hypothetical protein [Pseudarthrobacter sp. S9]|uniref:hypothetical protein n=1 Tax=Pseudarthrobacter sp. S9 TaxID=3418421 RepID=UPI003D028E74
MTSAPVEPAPEVPAPVDQAPVVSAPETVPAAPVPDPVTGTLPNGMTTVQVPGGPPPVKWGTNDAPAPGTSVIVNPSLKDVGEAPKVP